ncbi:hypothetical protein C8R47DRAFT_467704 [Mycena vitilis]|nr:hypothetical protein C8R47DRAFT_467704 [Mycena vitilis]
MAPMGITQIAATATSQVAAATAEGMPADTQPSRATSEIVPLRGSHRAVPITLNSRARVQTTLIHMLTARLRRTGNRATWGPPRGLLLVPGRSLASRARQGNHPVWHKRQQDHSGGRRRVNRRATRRQLDLFDTRSMRVAFQTRRRRCLPVTAHGQAEHTLIIST